MSIANPFLGCRPIKGTIKTQAKLSLTIDLHMQLTPTSHFNNDLGLDSLDTVEVVMAIEEVSRHDRTLGISSTDQYAGVQH